MDPYLILRLRRDCTRTELRETFRERARSAHPDHGGDEKQFIRICTAYKMILAELDAPDEDDSSSPRIKDRDKNRFASTDPRPTGDPYMDLFRRVSARSDAAKNKLKTSTSATVGGVIAVAIFVVCALASLTDDKSMTPVATDRTDPAPVTRPDRGDSPSLWPIEPLPRAIPEGSARDTNFPSLPPSRVDDLP